MNDIESVLAAMTIDEKAALTIGATAWTTTPTERLGVRPVFMADGPHGIRRVTRQGAAGDESIPATCFPTSSCTAASWDPDLVREVAAAIADEAIAQGVDFVLAPGVNMKRTPLCGRNFEYLSEDPFLAGEMAAAYVEGMQSRGVGTSLKHFAANNQEERRMTVDVEVDERTLREIYLPAFETVVKRARPWTVMCSYNRLDGTYASQNRRLLTEILRDEWGYDGMVVSDWGAVHDRVAALEAGLDLDMPGPRGWRVREIADAVRSGVLAEATLDEACRRILALVARAEATPPGAPFDAEAHHSLARRAAARSAVLLKNEGVLPLRPGQRVAVAGRAAVEPRFQGGGSSHVNPTRVDSPLEELRRAGGDRFVAAAGAETAAAVEAARDADVAVVFVASAEETEGRDRAGFDLPPDELDLIRAVTAAQPRTVVVLMSGSPVEMGDWIGGTAAVLLAGLAGQAAGGAIADVLFGTVNPSGRLAETYPIRLEDTPAFLDYPGERGVVRYGEGLFIGYRWYDERRMEAQFAFGHGLSYTTFEYSNAMASKDHFRDIDGARISVDVTNTGAVAGAEVVQVYVHDRESSLVRPAKELKGFARVELRPGEARTVEIALDFRAFAFWHPDHGRWVTEDGEFDVLVGASAADIRAVITVHLESTAKLPSTLSGMSTLGDWLADPRGRPLVEALIERRWAAIERGLGAVPGALRPGHMEHLKVVPLTDTLQFCSADGAADPTQLLDELLAALRI